MLFVARIIATRAGSRRRTMTCEGGPQPLNKRGVDSAVVLIVRILCVLFLAGFGIYTYFGYKAANRTYRYR